MTLKMKRMLTIIGCLVILAIALMACDEGTPAQTQQETSQVNDQQTVYSKNQPLKKYDYSPEKDELQQIYDARMQQVNTWTVIYPTNRPPYVCASRGYPIPYTTQLTNPDQPVYNGSGSSYTSVTVPQAEPNGLYTGQTSATWVMCIRNGKMTPVYAESDVEAFPYPVTVDPDGTIHDSGKDSSVSITIDEAKAARNGK